MQDKAANLAARLSTELGADAVLSDADECWAYGYDNSRRHAPPSAVAFATCAEHIQTVVRLCMETGTPLVTRGRGTGTTGAGVPLDHALVLSLERMNRILDVDAANRVALVEPGATNQALQDACAEHGFFWPPDPTSAAFCTIGGNLAYNSAGPRAVKYGTPRENTLGLRAVTGGGERIRTGTYTTKGVVGYDLTRLIIGSEGTLAIISEATLKLTPVTESKRTLQAVYSDMHAAARAVSAIMAQPVTPCALEFIDAAAIDMIRDYSECDLPADAGALLMIEVDGSRSAIEGDVASVIKAARVSGVLDIQQADTAEKVRALWATRKALSPALRKIAPKKINEDVVVPVSRMAELIGGLAKLGEKHRITIVNFGHAGNGNIHVNLLVDPDDPAQMQAAHVCLSEVFDLVLSLNGSLSGEHGVGIEKRDYVAREIEPAALALMHGIKAQFDPRGILNPGKTLPGIKGN